MRPDDAPLIVIADDDPDYQDLIEDSLVALEPMPRIEKVGSIEALLRFVKDHDVDLVTLDLDFSKSESGGSNGMDALPRLHAVHPRVPVVLVSGQLSIKVVDEAKQDRPIVRGVVEKGDGAFDDALLEASRQAIEWGREQRQKADALFERGLAIAGQGNAIDAARLFVEAHATGDLDSVKRHALRDQLHALLPCLEAVPELQVSAYRTLMNACWELSDELGGNYFAKAFITAFPFHEREGREFMALVAEIGDNNYQMVDERLELIRLHRDRGNYRQVVEECHLIQKKLGNILPSYRYEAEGYCAQGQYDLGVEAYFQLADIALRNGELDTVSEALTQITQVDRAQAHAPRVEAFKTDIVKIRERIRDIEANISYPYLRICPTSACRTAAELSNGFFRIFPEMPEGDCDLCGTAFLHADKKLAGKTITLIGGRFGPRYIAEILKLGAREVLHHDAIHELPRIPGLISAAHGILIVTGAASHAGTIKADLEITRMAKPSARVHFYGVKQVLRGLILDLLPRMES